MSGYLEKKEVLRIIDEVMNNREISSIRNAILAVRDKVIEMPEIDVWYRESIARIRLRGDNPLRCYGEYFEGAKYININALQKNDTRDYGGYWYE